MLLTAWVLLPLVAGVSGVFERLRHGSFTDVASAALLSLLLAGGLFSASRVVRRRPASASLRCGVIALALGVPFALGAWRRHPERLFDAWIGAAPASLVVVEAAYRGGGLDRDVYFHVRGDPDHLRTLLTGSGYVRVELPKSLVVPAAPDVFDAELLRGGLSPEVIAAHAGRVDAYRSSLLDGSGRELPWWRPWLLAPGAVKYQLHERDEYGIAWVSGDFSEAYIRAGST